MFSVLTLNLRFGLADDGPNNWQNRKIGFPALFDIYQTDFVGFQEANDFQIDFLDNMLKDYHYIGKRSPSPSFWQNNIIFYHTNWTCMHHEHFFLSPTPSVPSRYLKSLWPRQCTMGLFKKDKRQVICINTHLDFDDSVQVKSARLILDQLAQLPHNVPVILMGDFNAVPFSACYNIFTDHDDQPTVRAPCFKDAFGEPFTGTRHGFTGQTDGDHIDWILYRGKLAVNRSMVIQDTFNNVYVSDHFPLFAEFSWED